MFFMFSHPRPKQQEALPKVREGRSRIEQADFRAHEGSMTLCSQEVQGEAVGASDARAWHGGCARGCCARALGLAGVSCIFIFLLFRARLSGPRHADVKAVRAGSRLLRGVTSLTN